MAFEFPAAYRFADSHEYAHLDGELIRVGISAFAVDQSRRIKCREGFRQGQLDMGTVSAALNKQIERLSQRSISGKFAR